MEPEKILSNHHLRPEFVLVEEKILMIQIIFEEYILQEN
jgi:hypothetical protein